MFDAIAYGLRTVWRGYINSLWFGAEKRYLDAGYADCAVKKVEEKKGWRERA